MDELTHVNDQGEARMVDISDKEPTDRVAIAEAVIQTTSEVIEAVENDKIGKGDVMAACRIAGIMAAKRTSDLIPLCHPLPIDAVSISIQTGQASARFVCEAKTTARTGLEMEAMTAVSVAALTFYDMCKAMDKSMVIETVQLLEKSGGKSGSFRR